MTLEQARHNNAQLLSMLRGELQLQAHLFHAEARDRWQALERRWSSYQGELQRVRKAAAEARPEVAFAFEQLEDALRHEYAQFRDALKQRNIET